MKYRHYCLQFPLPIRAELKLRYKNWYAQSLFLEELESYTIPATLILPSDKLVKLTGSLICPRIIAFGNSSMLEASFLAGAHDFLKDPWDCRELIIRCGSDIKSIIINLENHEIVTDEKYLNIDGKTVNLSRFQNSIFYLLANHKNTVLPYSEIQENLKMDSVEYIKSLHVHVNRIRKMLKHHHPDIYGKYLVIENMRSRGYILKILC